MLKPMDVPRPSSLTSDEKEEARGRARARAERQIEEREHLRLEIESRWHLAEVSDLLKRDFVAEAAYTDPDTGAQIVRAETVKLKLQEAKLKMEGHLAMLRKVLPDLKTIEMENVAAGTEQDRAPLVQIVSYEDGNVIRTVNPRGGASTGPGGADADDRPEAPPPWLM